jgi:hypothetical protein
VAQDGSKDLQFGLIAQMTNAIMQLCVTESKMEIKGIVREWL